MVEQFWMLLYSFMTATIGGYATVGNDVVVYGGNALQAFLVALGMHGVFHWGTP